MAFFYNTLKFFDLPSLPVEYFEELRYIKNYIKGVKLPDSRIEDLIRELEGIKDPQLPLNLRQSLEEFSVCKNDLHLHCAEHKFQSELSKLTAKSLHKPLQGLRTYS